jgi:hypothetical protein
LSSVPEETPFSTPQPEKSYCPWMETFFIPSMPEKVSLLGSADFFVNVSFDEPKDFSCIEEDKNLIVGGKNMPVLTAGFSILGISIFPTGN